jgi:integrase/recombinase XerC
MKDLLKSFAQHLQAKNASPHTLRNYLSDLEQLAGYLTPSGAGGQKPGFAIDQLDHHIIREYMGHLYDQNIEKSSLSRKICALRSFCKFLCRKGVLKQNPAKLVKLP